MQVLHVSSAERCALLIVMPESSNFLNGERVDWTKEYKAKEQARKQAEFDLAAHREEMSKLKIDRSLEEKYSLKNLPSYGVKVLREDDIALYHKIRSDVEKEFEPKSFEIDYRSLTKSDFHGHVLPEKPKPEPRMCELVHEQPVTFWSEHCRNIPGMTQIGYGARTPFGRNASFTKPIDQYLNGPMPGEAPTFQR
ncbi:unnamed protein product [Dicrocoelium dendriticum]|nr:unnamed protein product [Dicrocoelium dendriticum]